MAAKEKYFNKFRESARACIDNQDRLNELLEQAEIKINKGKDQLSEAISYIQVFYRLLRAYMKGEYRDIPAQKLVLIVAAFLYLVSPIDAVFDFLPGGLIDDAAIFIWLFNSLKDEIDKFKAWEDSQQEKKGVSG